MRIETQKMKIFPSKKVSAYLKSTCEPFWTEKSKYFASNSILNLGSRVEMQLIILLFLILFQPICSHAQTLRGVMHVHSTYSNKKLGLEELLKRCQKSGVDVVFFTDHALRRWHYGIFPLSNLLGYTYEELSVLRAGPETYLSEINQLQKKYPKMILVPGIETAPFYFWSGNLIRDRKLVLNRWHEHMLILGLENPTDYRNLPVVSNSRSGKYTTRSIVLLLPLLLFIPTILLLKKGRFFLGATIFFLALLALVNNYPYRDLPFDPFHGDKGSLPYQLLIDYVRSKGGLVFWAHPDSPDFKEGSDRRYVKIKTSPYPENLLSTYGYNGFAAFYEGYRQSAVCGGYWDKALLQYCEGKRSSPVWAVGEVDYTDEPQIDEIQVVMDVKKRSFKGVLETLSNGKFYVLFKPQNYYLALDKFSVTACGDNSPFISFEISSSDSKKHNVKVKLIKNGKLFQTFEGSTPLNVRFIDHQENTQAKSYYRLDIFERSGSQILSNPVFFQQNMVE